MKKILAVVLALAMCICSSCGFSTKIRFGTAALGGIYHTFGNAFTELVSSENDKLNVEMKTTAGSAANLRLLSDGYIEMGIAQADIIEAAYTGSAMFGKKYQGYKAIAGLYTEACQIVVRADSSIKSLNDLQGKEVCIGQEESGSEQNANQILQAAGLNSRIVHTVNLNYTDAAQALKSGKIDAIFCTAGIKTTMIDELANTTDIRFLGIDDATAKKLISSYPLYKRYTIPANTYNGQTSAVHTLGIEAVLLANDNVSKEQAKTLTALLFDHAEDLQYSLPIDLELTEKQAVSGISIPFHAGAAEYYKEHGIDVATE